MEEEPFDLIVLGGGPGGYVAAIHAAQEKLRVACIDDRPFLGGTCLNVGCIPSKSLLEVSGAYTFAKKTMPDLGVDFSALSFDFAKMQKRKQQIIEGLGKGVAFLFEQHGVVHVQGQGRLVSPHTVCVNGKQIKADAILLATGSAPIALPGIAFDEKVILSSTGALSLPQVPQAMGIVGGGVIGVEIASVYQRLGCQVTVIEMLDHLCDPLDGEVRSHLLSILQKQGIQFYLSSRVAGIERTEKGCIVQMEGQEDRQVEVDCVLVAIGRRPYVEGLGLDAVGIALEGGRIAVDSNFRTRVPSVYAIGDLIEGPMLAHKASAEGIAFAKTLAGNPATVNIMAVPNIVYTDPEVASVGWTEEEARGHGLSLCVGKSAFKVNSRARCEGKTEGFAKVVGERTTGRLVGMHVLGPHASELIQVGCVLMQVKGRVEDLAEAPIGHPTLSEALKEAAESALLHRNLNS